MSELIFLTLVFLAIVCFLIAEHRYHACSIDVREYAWQRERVKLYCGAVNK